MHKSKRVKSEVRQIINVLTKSGATVGQEKIENPGVDATLAEGPSTSSSVGYQFSDAQVEDSDYLESDDDVKSETESDAREELAAWAVTFNISTAAINRLLGILRKYIDGIPKDAGTLKCTSKVTPVEKMGTGEYIHYGVEDSLTDFFMRKSLKSTEIHLNINIDDSQKALSCKHGRF